MSALCDLLTPTTPPPSTPTHTLFIELGCEELPPGFVANIDTQWQAVLTQLLAQHGLHEARIAIDKTPRRLAVAIANLPTHTPSVSEELKGPPLSVAEKEGQPTQAGLGFLKKNNATLADITHQALGKETYWVLHRTKAGVPVAEVLPQAVLESVLTLQGPRFMRWGSNQRSFPRPIRWLMAFWDETPLPLTLDLQPERLTAKPRTYGHRLLGEATGQPIAIATPKAYQETLKEVGKVIVSTAERKATIVQQLHNEATKLNAHVVQGNSYNELLDEVCVIVEHPSVMVGRFEPHYLSLPKAVLVTVMQAHQRYFPLEDANGDLLPLFLFVSNGNKAFESTIRLGNERVIRPRFDDAQFFYQEDMKQPLVQYRQGLQGVTFQKGLGSIDAKVERLCRLVPSLALALGLNDSETADALTATSLAKCDLVTKMVFEFTELQGDIGAAYARQQGHSAVVANAIADHYRPRFAGDAPALHPVSVCVALADKLDTWMGLFSQTNTKLPTGSKDPFGIRRLVNGVFSTLLANALGMAAARPYTQVNLKQLCYEAYQGLGSLAQRSFEEVWALAEPFALQRLETLLHEQNPALTKEVLRCSQGRYSWMEQPVLALQQALMLATLLQENRSFVASMEQATSRAGRLLASVKDVEVASLPSLETLPLASLASASDTALAATLAQVTTVLANASMDTLPIDPLVALASQLNDYLEHTLVNHEDASLKQYRLALLATAHRLFTRTFGDLAQLASVTAL